MMLRRLLDNENPDYIAVAFDTPGPGFRNELYPEYKANRDAMPEDMVPQIPLIKEIIKAHNIPMVEVQGYEADDVIGTLSHRAAEAGMQAVIVSGDKDMLQLVRGDEIVMYDPKKDVLFMGEDQIPEFFGCRPSQIIDLLTIWGDSSDNVPGVPGVGEKGAKKLLAEYGSIDGIYEHLDEIKRKSYREGFENARDRLPLTRKLVTICTDLDIPFEPNAFIRKDEDSETLHEMFEKLNFKSLLNESSQKLKKCSVEYTALHDQSLLKQWLDEAREKAFMVFDIETTSLNPLDAELVGFAIALDVGKAGYVPLRHRECDAAWCETAEAMLREIMADETVRKCAHNAKYDLSVLKQLGWDLGGIVDDTMLMHYLIDPGAPSHGMDALAESLLRYQTIHFEDVAGKGKEQVTFDQVPLEQAVQYAGEDADITFQLYKRFDPRLDKLDLRRVYEEVERPLVPVLVAMELNGVRIDKDHLAAMSEEMAVRLTALEQEIYELAGEEFNINSTKQLGHILFEKLELPVIKKTGKTKSYSTNQEVLEKLAEKGHELPGKLLEYRMLSKLQSTYVTALPKMVHERTGRVHSSFNQTIAETGRLSSTDPNLQNIPVRTELGREIRAAFIPQDGWQMVAADYSQIELRLMAHFSEDKTLVEGFRAGEDIHRRTAAEIMDVAPTLVTDDMRRAAKSINFGLIYGMGEFRLSQELGITRKQAKTYMETYFEKMPRVPEFRQKIIEDAKEAGEVRTFFGRRRLLPEITSKNGNLRARGERLAVNTLIQGTAAEIIKIAMVHLHAKLREEGLKARILLQVHDELVLECPPEEHDQIEKVLTETMEGVVTFKVPLTVEAHWGANWKEAK